MLRHFKFVPCTAFSIMKTLLFLSALVFPLAMLPLARAQEANSSIKGASQLKITFEDRKLVLEQDLQAKRVNLMTRYAEALGRIGQKYQADGKLNEVLIVQKEIEAAQKALLLPLSTTDEVPADLANARRVVEAELEKLGKAHGVELANLCRLYVQALENLKKTLTQAGDLTRATAVAAEIERVDALLKNPASSAPKRPLSVELQKGLILYYDFDDKDPSHTKDSSPSGNHGLPDGGGGSIVPVGRSAGARSFNGRNQRLRLSKAMPDSESLTLCVWLKYEGDTSTGGIFADFGGASGNDLMLALNGEKTLHLRADKDGLPLNTQLALRSSMKGDWHHLACVIDKKYATVYIDGKRADRVDQGGSNMGHHKGYVGWSSNGTDEAYFLGEMDELMIWNRPLSSGEVAEVFALTAGGS